MWSRPADELLVGGRRARTYLDRDDISTSWKLWMVTTPTRVAVKPEALTTAVACGQCASTPRASTYTWKVLCNGNRAA